MRINKITLIVLSFTIQFLSFSQVDLNGLEGKNWIISAAQFDDKSYVVSCQHSFEPGKIIMFDENGNQKVSKTLGKKEDWTFGERPFKRGYSLIVPVIDKKKKVCYNLFGKDGKLSVTIVNENLVVETVFPKEPVYKKFDGLSDYTPPVAVLDSEGNPFWAITQNRMGILIVKYNVATKNIEHKFHEFEGYTNVVKGYDHISASVIGYKNDKVYFARVTDRGHKKDNYTVTIYSIDKAFNLKSEKEITLKKEIKDLAMMVEGADALTAPTGENMLFTLHSISANNGGPIKQLWFFQYDGEDAQVATWANNTESTIYSMDMSAVETEEDKARFILGDDYGNAIAWDVDFNNQAIEGIKAVALFKEKEIIKKTGEVLSVKTEDDQIYSSLLFETLQSEEMLDQSESMLKSGHTPILFMGYDGTFFLIEGNYQIETVSFRTKF